MLALLPIASYKGAAPLPGVFQTFLIFLFEKDAKKGADALFRP